MCLLKSWVREISTRSNLWTAQLPWPSQGPAEREHGDDDCAEREHGEDDADEEVEEENDGDDDGEGVQNYEHDDD